MKDMKNDRTKTLDSHPEKICPSEKTPIKWFVQVHLEQNLNLLYIIT